MRKISFLLCVLAFVISASAQENHYELAKTKVVENLRTGDFVSAKSRLNLLKPYIDDSNYNEYQDLLKQFNDSVSNSYNKANSLREKKQYQLAIIEYQRLIGRSKEPLVKPLYAHIGYCYEMRSEEELARNNYQLGIKYNEKLSVSRMEKLESRKELPKNPKVDKDEKLTDKRIIKHDKAVTTTVPKDFVLIPSGTLYKYEDGYDNDHQKYIYKDVHLDAFYICAHEVTQEEYERTMGSNPSQIKGTNIPVNTVQFIDAIKYCNARSVAEGYDGFYEISNNIVSVNPNSNGYRLPNEYEWAFASRKDERTKTKYAGGSNIKDIAWYGGNSKCTLHQVCTKSPNQRGIYDMNGNVSEWLWKKEFTGHNCLIGSDFMTYILFGESDVVGSSYCSETNGFRVVLIIKGQNNSNIKNLQTVKHYIKEKHSSVEYKRKQDKENAERKRIRNALKAEAKEYVRIADQSYAIYVENFDETKGIQALTNYRKALAMAREHNLFFVHEKEKIEQCIKALEKEIK